MKPLSPKAQALVDTASAGELSPSRETLGRMRARVLSRVAVVGGTIAAGSSATVKAGIFGKSLLPHVLAFGISGAVLGGGTAAVIVRTTTGAEHGAIVVGTPRVASTSIGAGQGVVPNPDEGALSEPAPVAIPSATQEERSSGIGSTAAPTRPERANPPSRLVDPVIGPAKQPPEAVEAPLAPSTSALFAPSRSATTHKAPAVSAQLRLAPTATTTPRLAMQLDVLRQVHASLHIEDSAGALHQLDRNTGLFEESPLEEEMRIARIAALCNLGRHAQAQKEIAAFVARWPSSPHAKKMGSGCLAKGAKSP